MDHLCFCVLCSHVFASVHCCLVVTCWERADLLALVGDVNCIFVTFLCGILGQVWYFYMHMFLYMHNKDTDQFCSYPSTFQCLCFTKYE